MLSIFFVVIAYFIGYFMKGFIEKGRQNDYETRCKQLIEEGLGSLHQEGWNDCVGYYGLEINEEVRKNDGLR